jgi:hypothetical protein
VLNIYSLCNKHCDDTMQFVNLCVRPIPGAHMSLLCILFLSLKMGVTSGNQQGQVVPILETGSAQPHYISAQKYVVLECLRTLQNIGYNIPTYSSMGIQALNLGRHHDIGVVHSLLRTT